MSRFKAVASALVIPVALAGALSQGIGDAEAQQVRKVYSAKFLCGEFQPVGVCNNFSPPLLCDTDADCIGPVPGGICEVREGPVKPGNYQTAINIVNPTRKKVVFIKKAVLLWDSRNPPPPGAFEIPQPPGRRFKAVLDENWGMEIDCPDIRQVLLGMPPPLPGSPPSFIKGFVEIEVFKKKHDLDVVAAYTSHGFTGVPGDVCVAPGFPADGAPCDPTDPLDPCFADSDGDGVPDGTCISGIVGIAPEGFSTDVERVHVTLLP